jgi:hypothetical protein
MVSVPLRAKLSVDGRSQGGKLEAQPGTEDALGAYIMLFAQNSAVSAEESGKDQLPPWDIS